MSKICARDFSEYLEIQRPTDVADGQGGFTTTWASFDYIWARVEDTGGGEAQINGRLETVLSARITTTFRDDIQNTDRLVIDSILYNILRITDIDRDRKYLTITIESVVAT